MKHFLIKIDEVIKDIVLMGAVGKIIEAFLIILLSFVVSADLNYWFIFPVVTILVLIFPVYKNIKVLSDKTYYKQRVIEENDERNIHIEDMTYQFMTPILELVITGLILFFSVYFDDKFSEDDQKLLVSICIGCHVFNFILFKSIRFFLRRQL